MRYHLKEHIIRIKDDFTVRDHQGEIVFDVRGSFLRFGDEFTIYNRQSGTEVLRITEKVFSYQKQYNFFQNDAEIASIRKKDEPDFANNYFEITNANGMIFQLRGNFQEWDFEVVDHYHRLLGHISREFAFLSDTYTVDVADGVDPAFLIGIAVVLDEMKEDRVRTE